MKPSADCYALIRAFEGFSATPYRCPAGLMTIGYGHVIGPKEALVRITPAQGMALLEADAAKAAQAVSRLLPVKLRQCQFDALVSFTFNLGSGALQRSTLRQKVLRAEHDDVPHEFSRWVYAGGRVLPGLVRRRLAEAQLYQRG